VLRDEIIGCCDRLRVDRRQRQIEKWAELERRQEREKVRMEDRIQEFYGTARYRRELQELEQRKRKTPAVEERKENLRRSIANTERRVQDQRGAFARRCAAERKQLAGFQQQQKEADERRIAKVLQGVIEPVGSDPDTDTATGTFNQSAEGAIDSGRVPCGPHLGFLWYYCMTEEQLRILHQYGSAEHARIAHCFIKVQSERMNRAEAALRRDQDRGRELRR
jgi:rubrerythrin